MALVKSKGGAAAREAQDVSDGNATPLPSVWDPAPSTELTETARLPPEIPHLRVLHPLPSPPRHARTTVSYLFILAFTGKDIK